MSSINGNRGWVQSNSVEERALRSRCNIAIAGDGGSNVSSVEFAGVGSSSGVRIRSLGIDTMVADDVSEGLVHQTSIAAHVSLSSRTINEVLFRQADEFSGLEEVNTFDGSSGGEGPARTTLALVLDSCDSSFLSPVNLGRGGGIDCNVRVDGEASGGLGDVHAIVDG